ncbi:MAG: hypothetical protein IPJ88_03165 [Myxococcales bacterium]|nr:MAG: hypothetical protein IPJ88_03165 [Myxococcales bacterium]
MQRSMRFASLSCVGVVIAVQFFLCIAFAHGFSPEHADLRISGKQVDLVMTPTAKRFASFDVNHDGYFQSQETQASRRAMLKDFTKKLELKDEKGQLGKLLFSDLSTPHVHNHPERGASYLRVTLRYLWKREPKALVITLKGDDGETYRLSAFRFSKERNRHERRLIEGPVHHQLAGHKALRVFFDNQREKRETTP